MSLHINCLDWIVPQGNTAEGSRKGEGFSCDSFLDLLYNHCRRGSQRRQKAWKLSTDPRGFPGSWNYYMEAFSTNRNVSLPPCSTLDLAGKGSSSEHCRQEKRAFAKRPPQVRSHQLLQVRSARMPSASVPRHACVCPFTFKHTLFQPPPVPFLPRCPPQGWFCACSLESKPRIPPTNREGNPSRSLSHHSVPHHDQKTSLLSEQFFLGFGPFECWPLKFPTPPYPLPHTHCFGVTPCPLFFVLQASLPQPG